jgi:hypothetical protein
MKPMSLAVFTFVFVIIVSLAPEPVFAREPVDPTTLTPPPPPDFNPVCERVGNLIICEVQFSDPPFAGGIEGLICGSGADAFEPFVFQNRSVRGKRYYDENGNLLRRHFREVFEGTVTNPITHKALAFSGSDTHLHVLAVPGDNATGTEAITGSVRIFLGPGNGTLAFDTGRRVIDVAADRLVAESGQHPFDDYFEHGDTSALQPLCDALQ